MNAGRLIARLAVGGLFAAHGTQKLFGWFDGPGIDGTAKTMEGLELRPARRNALLVGLGETAGGALFALGALTPMAAATLTGSMITAIRKVHFAKGPWNTEGGYEFNVTLIAVALALVETGPGSPSVDRALGIERSGSGWALASLAAGAAGSTLAVEAAKRYGAQPEPTGRFERERAEAKERAGATA